MIRCFNIHNMIGLEWHNPLFSVVPDFAVKYHYFEVPALPEGVSGVLEIHSGRPPQEMTAGMYYASERFEIGTGIFSQNFQHGRMRWKIWVKDWDSARVKIWYDFPWYSRLQWPWSCFPDYMIGFQVIEPLIEYKLQAQNALVLHAGAFERDGKAVLLSGREGVHKTTYLMNALKKGGKYFADDLVILKNRMLYAYPICDSLFDYFYLRETSGQVNHKSMLGAFLHIRSGKKISFSVAKPQQVTQMYLILGRKEKECSLAAPQLSESDFLDRVTAVDKLERLSMVDEEEGTGRFMLQFNQVFGNDCWNRYWQKHRELLSDNLSGIPYKVIFSDDPLI